MLRLIETLDEFEAIAGPWNSLPGVAGNPLVSHDWFCAAAGTLHRDQRLLVITVWHDDKILAAAPLVEARLMALKEAAAKEGVNLMPPIIDASRDYVTLGEMCDALREVWGEYTEPPIF